MRTVHANNNRRISLTTAYKRRIDVMCRTQAQEQARTAVKSRHLLLAFLMRGGLGMQDGFIVAETQAAAAVCDVAVKVIVTPGCCRARATVVRFHVAAGAVLANATSQIPLAAGAKPFDRGTMRRCSW